MDIQDAWIKPHIPLPTRSPEDEFLALYKTDHDK